MNPADEHRSAADRLIIAAAGGRTLDTAELRFVREHVAQAGFSPGQTARASGLSGMVWQGRVLRGGDRITAADYHYLDHVVKREEWPLGTSLDDYVHSIRTTVSDPNSGVAVSYYRGFLQLSVIGNSGAFRGHGGFDWIVVEYRSDIGYWVTAFQPHAGLEVFRHMDRSALQWLQPQRGSTVWTSI
ncbi:MAG: hypothetical protein NTZ05_17620 [Chloroflexi bacterium]|nr:hypothetical protein [Chloroflexota bacterium]